MSCLIHICCYKLLLFCVPSKLPDLDETFNYLCFVVFGSLMLHIPLKCMDGKLGTIFCASLT